MPLEIGWSTKTKGGQYATIIAIRDENDIDVQFEDGGIVKHITYHKLLMRGFKSPIAIQNNPHYITFDKVKKAFEERGYILLSTEYVSATSPLFYICSKHPDKIQKTTWNKIQQNRGCKECGYERVSESLKINKKTPFAEVLEKFETSGLKLLTKEEEYLKESNPILKFICPCSPDIIQEKRWSAFLQSPHCSLCFKKEEKNKYRESKFKELQDFCQKIGYQLLSNLTDYQNMQTKILVNCPKHGSFATTFAHLLEGKGCPYCAKTKSNGEIAIAQFLDANNIKYIRQKSFDDLKVINKLRYDFYLPEYNLLIEYQGEYHDGTVHKLNSKRQTSKDLEEQQHRDKLKKQYALDHNINFLEIWYWDFKNIEQILRKELGLIEFSVSGPSLDSMAV